MTRMAMLGITMGDPSGIGPEIIVKALADMSPEQRSTCAVVGNLGLLQRADRVCGTGLAFQPDYKAARGRSACRARAHPR